MRLPFILCILVSSLYGCAAGQKVPQVPADQVVDEQIAQSANALSLAQLRLHQTSAAQQATSLTGPAPTAATVQQLNGSGGLISSPNTPTSVKSLPSAPASAPAKVVVVEVPAPAPRLPVTVHSPAKPLAPQVAVPAPKPVQEPWVVSPNDVTLRRVLAKWTARAGWQLVWDASVDVPVTVSASLDGDFKTAVKRLFQSLSASDVNLNVLLYTGNRVLRVTESGRRAQ